MIKVLFICHGNICRSPMAEFVMKDLVRRAGCAGRYEIASAATSSEEIGNPVYPPAQRKLAEHGIGCAGKTARRLTRADYAAWDLLIGMDEENLYNMRRLCGGDLSRLDGKMVGDAADAGDLAAVSVMEEYVQDLAIGLGNIYNIFQPEVLILGGGVSARGEKLLEPLRQLLQPEIYGGDMSKVDIRIATLGNDAGVIGAACLVMQEQ